MLTYDRGIFTNIRSGGLIESIPFQQYAAAPVVGANQVLIPDSPGQRVRVFSLDMFNTSAAGDSIVAFRTSGGPIIYYCIAPPRPGNFVKPFNEYGYFETAIGQGLNADINLFQDYISFLYCIYTP